MLGNPYLDIIRDVRDERFADHIGMFLKRLPHSVPCSHRESKHELLVSPRLIHQEMLPDDILRNNDISEFG